MTVNENFDELCWIQYIISAWSWKDGQKISRYDWLNPCSKLNDQIIFEHIIYSETYPTSEMTLQPASTTYCGTNFNISKYHCFKTQPDFNWAFRKIESFFEFERSILLNIRANIMTLCKLWPTLCHLWDERESWIFDTPIDELWRSRFLLQINRVENYHDRKLEEKLGFNYPRSYCR